MKKILLVDDDRLAHEMIEAALAPGKTGKYTIDAAYNADEALALLGRNHYDLMISDIIMPGKDGFQLMQHARESFPGMAILAITAGVENAVEDYVEFADIFADYALEKPFSKKALIEVVETLLETKGGIFGGKDGMTEKQIMSKADYKT